MRPGWIFCVASALAALGGAPTAAVASPKAKAPPPALTMPQQASWCLEAAGTPPTIVYHGLLGPPRDDLGARAFLYPAPSAAIFVAAIAAHAAVVGGIRGGERSNQLKLADKILEPYQPIIANFSLPDLRARGLADAAADGRIPQECPGSDASAWIVRNDAVFFLTQDERALVIESAVTVRPAPASPSVAYVHPIRVISPPVTAEYPFAAWTENEGARWRESTARLFRESIDIALRLASGDTVEPGAPYHTFHVAQGSVDLVERAQLLDERCERVILKTLRGTYLSAPTLNATCSPMAKDPAVSPAQSAHTP